MQRLPEDSMEPPDNPVRPDGEPSSSPDIMNDPAYATNAEGANRNPEEPDTCRICRGEGSEEEQLFYPCKCSGSIKFVHQACLVEWLSHSQNSQKKYCELCKTPFRFTKLYDPNMPQDLPAPLFVRQILVHSFRTVVAWLRLLLVAFVWLGWLPWSMRAIWRAVFWLADGRWPSADIPQRSSSEKLFAELASHTRTAAATITYSSRSPHGTQSAVPYARPSQSPPSSILSFPAGEPLMLTLLKKAASALFFPGLSSSMDSTHSTSTNSTTGFYRQRQPSWLSDVKFLNSLTPSPTFNNIIIDTLEGQLITLLVVISFIVVFLIREWVVQQQPAGNIAEGEHEAAVRLIANEPPNHDEAPEPEEHGPFLAELQNDAANEQAEDISDHEMEGDHHATTGTPGTSAGIENLLQEDSAADPIASPQTRPRLNQGVESFGDLWVRGNEDPEQVLRIIREEGREEELQPFVVLMRRLRQAGARQSPLDNHDAAGPSRAGIHATENEAADDWLEHSRHTFDAPENRPRSHSESRPSATLGRPWDPLFPPSADFADNPRPNSPQHEFAFNFPGDARDSPNPFETQQNQALAQPHRVDDRAVPQSANSDVPIHDAGHAGDMQMGSQLDDSSTHPSKSAVDTVLDWFWGDIVPQNPVPEHPQQDEEHIVEDPALEAPFVPVLNHHVDAGGDQHDHRDDPAAADAPLDPNDADAIEEGEDLEGVLELIGMQGPIFGLLQNAVFSALLISFTVALGIWLPYLWGKIALVLLANPVRLVLGVPMTAVSVVADVTLDTLIGSLGYVLYGASLLCKVILGPLAAVFPFKSWIPQSTSSTSAALSLINASSHRLKNVADAFFIFHESDIPMFSVLSHQALKMHEARILGLFKTTSTTCKFVLHDFPIAILSFVSPRFQAVDHEAVGLKDIFAQSREYFFYFVEKVQSLTASTEWINSGSTKSPPVAMLIDADLAVWNTRDRIIAILMGYLLASLIGLLYLRITGLISNARRGQRIEGVFAEVLQQAGGVLKVILIIGIEMIVFPLYCGLLLDVALLPLFENATTTSRINFTSSSPLTSLFVHWFIGTCYMFHFALFVSMCRKIMRNGVLCK